VGVNERMGWVRRVLRTLRLARKSEPRYLGCYESGMVALGGDVDLFFVEVGGDHVHGALDGAGVFANDFDGVASQFGGLVGVTQQIDDGVLKLFFIADLDGGVLAD